MQIMAWLYKRPGSKFYWMGWRANGRQFLRSTGKTRKKDAEEVLAQYELMAKAKEAGALTRDFYLSLMGQQAQTMTLAAALDEWEEGLQTTVSEKSFAKYKREADVFRKFVNADDKGPALEDVDAAMIRRYLNHRQKTTSTATANVGRKILSGFFKRQVKDDRISSNPVAKTDTLKENAVEKRRAKRRALTLEEFQELCRQAPDDFWRYMLLMGFYTGMRLGDAACLRWGAVDFKSGFIRHTAAKTGKTLNIPMRTNLAVFLKQLKKRAGRVTVNSYVWPDRAENYHEKGAGPLSNEFYDVILAPCGLVRERADHKASKEGRDGARGESMVSYHSLRHTFVTMMRLYGGNQAVAKELAGHSSDLVNDMYTHVPEDALQDAMNRLPEVEV